MIKILVLLCAWAVDPDYFTKNNLTQYGELEYNSYKKEFAPACAKFFIREYLILEGLWEAIWKSKKIVPLCKNGCKTWRSTHLSEKQISITLFNF